MKMKKTTLLEAYSKHILLGVIVLVGVILMLSSVSAISINPFTKEKQHESSISEDTDNYLKEEFNSKYGIIKLSKTSWWILKDRIADYSLTKNTEYCLNNCEAEGRVVLYSDSMLFDDIKFKTLKGYDTKIIDSKYYIFKGYKDNYVQVPDTYKTICEEVEDNHQTKEKKTYCNQVPDTYKRVNQPIELWAEYKGEILPKGNYRWKIKGVKNALQEVDFIPIVDKMEFNEWAVWLSSYDVGLVGYWSINEGTGATTANVFSGLYNGTLFGGVWNTTQYLLNNSYQFVVPSSINMTGSQQLGWQSNLSYTFWIYPTLAGCSTSYDTLVMAGAQATSLLVDFVGATCQLRMHFAGGGGQALSTAYPTPNAWNFVVATHSAGGNTRLYVNGTQHVSVTGRSWTNETYVQFGRSNQGNERYTGLMDEIGIWNRTLTATEITDMYNAGAGMTWTATLASLDVTLTNPSNNYQSMNTQEQFNASYTYSNLNIGNATLILWHSNGSVYRTNVTIINNITNVTQQTISGLTNGSYTWGVIANDTSNNADNTRVSSNRTIVITNFLERSQSYPNTTIEGASERFGIFFSILSSLQVSSGDLIYVNNSYNGAITSLGGGNYTLNRTLTIPNVTATMGRNFWWNITLSDNSVFNSTMANLSVTRIIIDNCTSGTIRLLNFTLRDEDTQALVNNNTENTSIEVDVRLSSPSSPTALSYFSNMTGVYNNVSQTLVCLNVGIGSSSFRLDAQVKYDGGSYASELFNIQNSTLTNASLSRNITLLHLRDNRATECIINYKDENFLPVSNALFTITRKYIGEGIFKTIEAPLSDTKGQAVASFVENEVIYTIQTTKNGVLLGTLENQQVKSQNPVTSDCRITFSSSLSSTKPEEFNIYGNLTYVLTSNNTARTLTLTFSTTDGVAKAIQLNGTRFDNFGNTSICSPYLLSSSGSLLCTVPASAGNFTLITSLYSNGELIVTNSYRFGAQSTDIWGTAGYVYLLILVILIPLMFASSTVGAVLGSIFGLIIAGLMVMYNGAGALGIGAAVIWAIIAGGVIIWKITSGGND